MCWLIVQTMSVNTLLSIFWFNQVKSWIHLIAFFQSSIFSQYETAQPIILGNIYVRMSLLAVDSGMKNMKILGAKFSLRAYLAHPTAWKKLLLLKLIFIADKLVFLML